MKKTFLAAALAVAVSGAAHAQKSDVSLGLKAGATYSDIVGPDAGFYKDVFGFHAGVFTNIGFTDMLAFQPEVLYSQKGAKSLTLAGDYVTSRLHYVDVPLAFHVNADGLFFEAGPQVGFLVLVQDIYGGTTSQVDRNNYKVLDFGYLAGLGYQRKTGLGAGLRYNGAFSNTRQSIVIGSITQQTRARNSAFQLYLTYSLNGR